MGTETADIKSLTAALKEKVALNNEIAASFAVNDSGTVEVSEDQKSAFTANIKDIKELNELIEGFNAAEKAEKFLLAPAGSADFGGAPQAYQGRKSLGELFIDSPEFKELGNGRNGVAMRTPFKIAQANIGDMWRQKDLYSGTGPTTGDFPFGTVQREGMIERNRRVARVRDLFPVQTTSAAMIEYFRSVGFTNNAAPVPQRASGNFGIKPQSNMQWEGYQAPIRTIAHWEVAHRNVLADEPQLRGMIDNELLYGLRLEEDFQILAGTGVGEDIEGILNTPGIQSYSWSAGATAPVSDTKADAIRRAATLAFLSFYEPTGVVVHPNDWEDIELTKNADGDYLLAVSIALGGSPRVWNMPVIATPAIEEGTALLGSFGLGATLYDREEANVRIAEQHADLFIRNAVVVLAEERIGMAVKRPESFVEIKFDNAPTV